MKTPACMTNEHKFPEYRYPVWLPSEIDDAERAQVQAVLDRADAVLTDASADDDRRGLARVYRYRARILLGLDEPEVYLKNLIERRRRDAEAPRAPDLHDRISSLPPHLAKSVQGLIDAARETTRRSA